MKRPLLGITIAFMMGILLESFLDIPVFFIFGYASTALISSLLLRKSQNSFLFSAFFCFVFIGALVFKNYISFPEDHVKNIAQVTADLPRQVIVRGTILNEPAEKLTYYKQKQRRFLLEAKEIRINNVWRKTRGTLLVNAFNPMADLSYADEVILEGALWAPRPATNPGQFDYKKFLERERVFYILAVREGNFSKITGRSRVDPVKLLAYKASARIEALIDKYASGQEGAILEAILLGKRQDIEEDINEDFVKTGTVHILAISGLHVGLLAGIFILLFKLLRLPFRAWSAALTVFLIFYCIMVNSSPPIVRSTIMILVFLFGRVLKREQDSLNSLAFAALAILLFNPQDIFDVGFQLSFLTVGSIIYFTLKLETIFIKGTYLKRDPPYILRALIVSFCAWLGSAPFIARYFNIFSPITIIANLFVVPWMFVILATSLTFIIAGFFSDALALIFSEVSKLSILILIKAVSAFKEIPFSYFRVKSPAWIFIAGFYIFLFLFFNRAYLKIKAKYFLITVLVFFNLFVWHNVFFNQQRLLKITFLDVGKADSFVLQFPKSGTMLIDGGEALGFDMGRAVVSRFLASEGINRIDAVVSTHPHTDHVGGLVTILKDFEVLNFIENGDIEENPLYPECQALVKNKKVRRSVVFAGNRIKGFGDAEIRVLNPPEKKFSKLNNNSLVFKLTYGNFSVIFCGDILEEGAREMLARNDEKLSSTVLKVPHHGGSLGNIASEFLEKINPEIAIIAVRNKKVDSHNILILKELHTRVYSTDEYGAVTLTTDGKSYNLYTNNQ